MADAREQWTRLENARRPLGGERRTLRIGEHALAIDGLSDELCATLERRWGHFLGPATSGEPSYTIELRRAGSGTWLEAPQSGEHYRVETFGEGPRQLVASYHFAIGREKTPSGWRVAISDTPDEPAERIVDNALRYLTAHLAVERGGFAMHAAGVLHEGRAWLFAGPSRAGKSSVVRLLAPAACLGDDFGLVLPSGAGWSAPAVPFDNAERIGPERPVGAFPVAGIWRLYQAPATRVENPRGVQAVSSLLACTAFSWAMPEQTQALVEQVGRFVAGGAYRHLHFTRHASLWSVLL